MAFNVAKIASARASLTISLTKSLRVAGPLVSLDIVWMSIQRLDYTVNEIRCCCIFFSSKWCIPVMFAWMSCIQLLLRFVASESEET